MGTCPACKHTSFEQHQADSELVLCTNCWEAWFRYELHSAPSTFARAWAFFKRVLRTAHSLARDPRLPKWLRILFLIGCVQIPVLPFDEIAMVMAVSILAIRHRPILREAWARTAVHA